jgi:putative transposase
MKSDGPLFRGRFKALVIDADDYLVQVSRYIHRNPIEAKLVKKARNYSWSSMNGYLNPNTKPKWLHTYEVLSRVHPKGQAQELEKLVDNSLLPSLTDFYGKNHVPVALGSDYFRKNLPTSSANNGFIKDVNHHLETLTRIIATTASYFKVDPKELTTASPGRANTGRLVAMALAKTHVKLPLATIGQHFGVTKSAVSLAPNRYNALVQQDHAYQAGKSDLEEVRRLFTTHQPINV